MKEPLEAGKLLQWRNHSYTCLIGSSPSWSKLGLAQASRRDFCCSPHISSSLNNKKRNLFNDLRLDRGQSTMDAWIPGNELDSQIQVSNFRYYAVSS